MHACISMHSRIIIHRCINSRKYGACWPRTPRRASLQAAVLLYIFLVCKIKTKGGGFREKIFFKMENGYCLLHIHTKSIFVFKIREKQFTLNRFLILKNGKSFFNSESRKSLTQQENNLLHQPFYYFFVEYLLQTLYPSVELTH